MGRIILGAVVASGTYFWWYWELAGWLGQKDASGIAFPCLVRIGAGECAPLWLLGLHQTNQIASLIFYGGLVLCFSGITTLRNSLKWSAHNGRDAAGSPAIRMPAPTPDGANATAKVVGARISDITDRQILVALVLTVSVIAFLSVVLYLTR